MRSPRFFGAETRIFDPSTLPVPDQGAEGTIRRELCLPLHVDDGSVFHLLGSPEYQALSRKGAQQPASSEPTTKAATAATMANPKSRYAAAAA